MIKSVKNYLILITAIFAQKQLFAQGVDMADSFRAEGKIYVVIAVIAIVFLGFIGYLINVDLKLKKLEEKNKQE